MILPLLCASLIACASFAPAVLPQFEDFSNSNNSMMVRKNAVTSNDVPVTDFPIPAGSFVSIKLPYTTYWNTGIGATTNVDFDFADALQFSQVFFLLNDVQVSCEFSGDNSDIDTESFAICFWLDVAPTQFDNFQVSFSDGDDNSFTVSGSADAFFYDDVLAVTPSEDADLNYIAIPSVSPDGVEVVGEIVSILGAGIGQLGAAIGSGVSSFASSLAFDGNGNMSIYLIMVIALASVALACGLTAKLFAWLTSLGN